MSHIGQYAEMHYVSAHENEEMQRKRRDKGGEMSESWAAGCILQSAWDTSECAFVCSSLYVCLRVFGRKEAHSHPLNPMIQPSLHQAWAWEREKQRKKKSSLSEKAREERHGEEREASKINAMRVRECFFIHFSLLCCNVSFSWCSGSALWRKAAGPRMGRVGQVWGVFDGFSSFRIRLRSIISTCQCFSLKNLG